MVRFRPVAIRATLAAVSVGWLVAFVPGGGSGASPASAPADGVTRRVSVGPGGVQANGHSFEPTISADGRYVGFDSLASNLVAGDIRSTYDGFVRDRVDQMTQRVPGQSGLTAMSARGRYVAFLSSNPNLVPGDTNFTQDLFVRDRVAKVTRLVSVAAICANPHGCPNGPHPNGPSGGGSISAHGRYVAFTSNASNLVPGDTNFSTDVFVRDRVARVTRRVSVGQRGAQANGSSSFSDVVISADGRFVAFTSSASNLVAGDSNGSRDVFVRDRVAQVTRRVSVGPAGAQANGPSAVASISAHGRYVAFRSAASNFVAGDTNDTEDVFIRDRVAQVTRRVSVGRAGVQANKASYEPMISGRGRYVVFTSGASNLVAGDTNNFRDVFVRDRVAQVTRRISVGWRGAPANKGSFSPVISASGQYVAFTSAASNLVVRDTNNRLDIFVRKLFG